MSRRNNHNGPPRKAYENPDFIKSRTGRPLRILSEHLEPSARFEAYGIEDTIVFFGSARILPPEKAEQKLVAAHRGEGDLAAAERTAAMSRYYEDARELAHRLTLWSKGLSESRLAHGHRFVVCTGGGPGIMEAANRGASEARGVNVGLNIALSHEQQGNPYITRELAFEFNYFFMRKFWFAYLAKAIVVFPGGFGTLDEFFELITLVQTRKMEKKLSIVLYGTDYWNDILNFDALVRHEMVDPADLGLFHRCDTVDAAFEAITRDLMDFALGEPGGRPELV
ncbi:MAG: TIGR00730 family Rossman fold protein [Magnetospirillum sp. WYHS-4]